MRPFRLRKTRILRGHGAYSAVLSRNISIKASPLRCFYDIRKEIPPCSCTVGFAVRREPLAVQRNRAKRRMREAYRLQGLRLDELCRERGFALRCVFMFAPHDGGRADFLPILQAMIALVDQLALKLERA